MMFDPANLGASLQPGDKMTLTFHKGMPKAGGSFMDNAQKAGLINPGGGPAPMGAPAALPAPPAAPMAPVPPMNTMPSAPGGAGPSALAAALAARMGGQ